ncbi:hypothetical protein [Helicobacter kayseriensis]|uniref:hypothetical protein n=1 Tax=Helicobacter kayseriensis TaxID=2905877 RepID=UPI001E63C2FC|nr:hypothetical protein [Helicobacter kayseriensis]MCE3047365.1 hypothetical protein [Helicobacter kayseriensis]MCE3048736.1 hypothetical protein [Helicobacter kayseriensis]
MDVLWSEFALLEAQDWLWVCLWVLVGGVIANAMIAFYTLQKNQKNKSMLLQIFCSKSLIACLLFCFADFVFVVVLYGVTPYACLIAGILYLLFVMSYIDSIMLAVPDWINFLCFFGVFGGLYYLGDLRAEHLISAFCVAGGLSILRIFGNFVFQKEILGEADIIVFASMGAIVLIDLSLYLIILACVIAMGYILLISLFALKGKEIALSGIKVPFVVFLTLAFVLILVYVKFGENFV